MPKADRGHSDKSHKQTSSDSESGKDRMISDKEWEGLLEDAEAFKERHEKAFRILSGREE